MQGFKGVLHVHIRHTRVAFPEHLTHIFVHLQRCLRQTAHPDTAHSTASWSYARSSPQKTPDVSRLPAAPGHQRANQSQGSESGPYQSTPPPPPPPPPAEASSLTVYHLNQTDIWRVWGCSIHLFCLCGLCAL